jgi:hypothetical protein
MNALADLETAINPSEQLEIAVTSAISKGNTANPRVLDRKDELDIT